VREVQEETGIDARGGALVDWGIENRYEIYPEWRWRYAPGVTHNVEHVFGLTVPAPLAVTLAPAEHSCSIWLPWREAAAKCFSWSNRDAILMLPERRVH
jgi:dATP pyrophosphohydrolase